MNIVTPVLCPALPYTAGFWRETSNYCHVTLIEFPRIIIGETTKVVTFSAEYALVNTRYWLKSYKMVTFIFRQMRIMKFKDAFIFTASLKVWLTYHGSLKRNESKHGLGSNLPRAAIVCALVVISRHEKGHVLRYQTPKFVKHEITVFLGKFGVKLHFKITQFCTLGTTLCTRTRLRESNVVCCCYNTKRAKGRRKA